MKTKRVSVLLCLSFIIMLASLATIPLIKADEVYYTWDSATHGTNIYAPLGQIGAEAKANADATGLIKVRAAGGFGFLGIAEAWGELYITLDGQGRHIQPIITYEVQGIRVNFPTARITLTVIDRATGETVGQWSADLPHSKHTIITTILYGDFFEVRSDRQYLYWVKVYVSAPIVIPPAYLAVADYDTPDYHIKVKQLYIAYNAPSLSISTTTGGTTNPAPGTYTYTHGESVTVTATADIQYVVYFWVLDGIKHFVNPITVIMNTDRTLKAYFRYIGSGGGGGCPTLFVWNGSDYVDYGVINIHDVENDVIREVPVQAEDVSVSGHKVKFALREGWEGLNYSHSLIDQVKLYAVDSEGNRLLCPLIKAEHSEQGRVLFKLLFSDDYRTDTYLMDTIDLTFKVPYPTETIENFTFIIEGHNPLKQ